MNQAGQYNDGGDRGQVSAYIATMTVIAAAAGKVGPETMPRVPWQRPAKKATATAP